MSTLQPRVERETKPAVRQPPEVTRTVLEVSRVSKAFGGLLALNDVDCTVSLGRIKGIIGPNGAGKTTLFNLISGLYQPTRGDIRLNGESIVGLKPSEIAACGVARTFQNVRIFDNMTVLENVMAGRHVRTDAGFLASALRLPKARREEKAIIERAMELLETVGLADQASKAAASLPLGLQRTLEIARALATEPTLLMLDEPAAGLNLREQERLGDLICQIREQGITVILVEHNMDLVMGLVDEVLVLDHGTPIAEGSPEEVQQDQRVITAYLGEEN